MKKFKFNKISIIVLVAVFGLGIAGILKAADFVSLGTADSFAILAGSGITNTGATTVTGNIGTFPTLTETGFGTVTITSGVNYVGNAITQTAKTDLTTAYNDAAGQVATTVASELGGTTKGPGVYDTADGELHVTNTLTLNGGGDPNAIFIFKAGSTLTTSSGSTSHISLIGSAQACNVFWQVGSSATIGTGSDFKGNILAFSSITDDGGSTIEGRFLARNAAVTLNNTTITKATCAGAPADGTLEVTKTLINDNGGNLDVTDFGFSIDGGSTISFESDGTNDIALSPGTYDVTEPTVAGYATSLDCSSLVVTSGNTTTCAITNDDITPTLKLVKVVNNTHGGDKSSSDWTLSATGTGAFSDTGDSVTFHEVKANETHTLSESIVSGYNEGSWSCDGGSLVGDDLTLGLAENVTCTITNTYIQPPSSGSTPIYGCKDPAATNYNYFSSSKPELCTYASVIAVVTPTPVVIIPKLPKTGFPPQGINGLWYDILFSNILNLFR